MKKALFLALALAGQLVPGISRASTLSIMEVPTAWRLENYVGNSVVAWFTSATCTGGVSQIHFGADATTDDKNRFWSLVMTAKVTNKKVAIYYDSASCNIVSFSLPEGA